VIVGHAAGKHTPKELIFHQITDLTLPRLSKHKERDKCDRGHVAVRSADCAAQAQLRVSNPRRLATAATARHARHHQ